MGDGAMCHYCRKYRCECPEPVPQEIEDAVTVATWMNDQTGTANWYPGRLKGLDACHEIEAKMLADHPPLFDVYMAELCGDDPFRMTVLHALVCLPASRKVQALALAIRAAS